MANKREPCTRVSVATAWHQACHNSEGDHVLQTAKRAISAGIVCIGLSSPTTAEAKVIIWGEQEKLIKVADLPDRSSFRTTTGYYDLGIIYGEFSVFFLPALVYDARWIGYVDDSYYIDLKEWEIKRYLSITKVSVSNPADHIPFWNQYGGKLIVIPLLIIGVIWLVRKPRKKSEAIDPDR